MHANLLYGRYFPSETVFGRAVKALGSYVGVGSSIGVFIVGVEALVVLKIET